MSHMMTLLGAIRRRPGMYLGKPSISRLGAYLDGYEHAAQEFGGEEPDEILPAFRDWIHERAGSTQYSWEETILQESTDDADAQERFWKLLDEFLALRGTAFASGTPGNVAPFPVAAPTTDGIISN